MKGKVNKVLSNKNKKSEHSEQNIVCSFDYIYRQKIFRKQTTSRGRGFESTRGRRSWVFLSVLIDIFCTFHNRLFIANYTKCVTGNMRQVINVKWFTTTQSSGCFHSIIHNALYFFVKLITLHWMKSWHREFSVVWFGFSVTLCVPIGMHVVFSCCDTTWLDGHMY